MQFVKALFNKTLCVIIIVVAMSVTNVLAQSGSVLPANIETYIDNLETTIKNENSYVQRINTSVPVKLPVCLVGNNLNDTQYGLIIDKITFKAERAYFNGYATLTGPDGTKAYFKASDIPLSKKGGLTGAVVLQLINKKDFSIGNQAVVKIKDGSKMNWNCDGFASININGSVQLSQSTFIPVNATTFTDIPSQAVSSDFNITATSYDDIKLGVSLPSFRVTGVPDMFFTCSDMSFDLSSKSNPDAMYFTTNYYDANSDIANNAWNGLFIENATVTLSKKFQKKGSTLFTSFTAKNIIIDNKGFSLDFNAKDLLTISEGDMSGWAYAIDRFRFSIVQNKVVESDITGKIQVPVFGNTSLFHFTGGVSEAGQYNFALENSENLIFAPLGNAKVNISKGSTFTINSVGDGFVPTMNLSGDISIMSPNKSTETAEATQKVLGSATFTNFEVFTVAPYFKINSIVVDPSEKGEMVGFPFELSSISFETITDKLIFNVGGSVQLLDLNGEKLIGNAVLSFENTLVNNSVAFSGISIKEFSVAEKTVKLGDVISYTIKPESKLTWTNFHFESFDLVGNIAIISNDFKAVDASLKDIAQGTIQSNVSMKITSFNDFNFSATLPTFRSTKVPDMFFNCGTVVVDFSNTSNPSALALPETYTQSLKLKNVASWRGIYIEKAEISLSKNFNKKNSSTATKFSTTNLVIDSLGLSGNLNGYSLLTIDEGDINGWGFAVDTFELSVLKNSIQKGKLAGKIRVPAFSDQNLCAYQASITVDGEYGFSATLPKDLELSFLGSSTLTLESSSISISKVDGNFEGAVKMSGGLSLSIPTSLTDKDKTFSLPNIKFSDLEILTTVPYIRIGTVNPSDIVAGTFSGFPVELKKLELTTPESKIVLAVGVKFDLGNVLGESIEALANIAITSEYINKKFSFKGISLKDFSLPEKTIPFGKDVSITVQNTSKLNLTDNGYFESFKVDGILAMNSENYIPVNTATFVDSNDPLQSTFSMNVSSWSDFTFAISLPTFRLKSFADVFYSCQNLAVDFSDNSNPEGIVFPTNYSKAAKQDNYWQGLYIAKANVILGEKFKKKDATTATSFEVANLLIDDQGLTGDFTGTGLLTLEQGSMSGWAFSLDKMRVKILMNSIEAVELVGEMKVPCFKEDTKFAYTGFVDAKGVYGFIVATASDLEFSLMGSSKMTLLPTSQILVSVVDKKFVAKAKLTGSLSLNCAITSSKSFGLSGISFENLEIQSKEPYLKIGSIGFAGSTGGSFGGFGLTVSNIKITSIGDKITTQLSVAMNLSQSSEDGIGGKTTILINSKYANNKFSFEGVSVQAIQVDFAKSGAFELHGRVVFIKNDPVYGNGFRGDIDVKFADKFGLKSVVLFGCVQETRYFFVDALFTMKPGITCGYINLTGFSGGLYSHMRQQVGVVDPKSLGASLSGLVYVPDESISLGIMAGVEFNVCSDKVIDAKAKFEIAFNSSGGINSIEFRGSAECVVPSMPASLDRVKSMAGKLTGGGELSFTPAGLISVQVVMRQDFMNNSFDATFDTYINAGLIKGLGSQGKAGWGKLHIDPSTWYLYMGTPTNPMGLDFVGIAQAGGYFMAGHGLPTEIPINPKVAAILGANANNGCSSRSGGQIQNGKGMAFGAFFAISTGDINFIPFYASFDMGAGFDLMLLKHRQGSHCEGKSASIGINNWYAQGQAYAYLDGKIGVEARVFGSNRKFEIMQVAAAFNLITEGPSPIYMEGQVAGSYNVCGGLVKGKFNCKVTAGEKCRIVEGTLPEPSAVASDSYVPVGSKSTTNQSTGTVELPKFDIISDVFPANNQVDISVFPKLTANFNIEIDKQIDYTDENGTVHYMKPQLVSAKIKKGDAEISGNVKWNTDKTTLEFTPNDMLEGEEKYTFEVKVEVKEKTNGNWASISGSTETNTTSFSTSYAPKEIPLSNIEYSYPIDRQYNFYRDEYANCYIKFTSNVLPFFKPVVTYNKIARFVEEPNGKVVATADINYDASNKIVIFKVPTALITNKIYRLELLAKHVKTNEALAEDVKDEIVFLKYNFRTSNYKTFSEKITQTYAILNRETIEPFVYSLNAYFKNNNEIFDYFELYGNNNKPLVTMNAVLEKSPWYQSVVYPLIYKDYPLLGIGTLDRNNEIPPVNSVYILQTYGNHKLEDNEIANGYAAFQTNNRYIEYNLPVSWAHDYSKIRNKLANYCSVNRSNNEHVMSILGNFFWPIVNTGKYPVKINYKLPGIDLVTTTKEIDLFNPTEQPQLKR